MGWVKLADRFILIALWAIVVLVIITVPTGILMFSIEKNWGVLARHIIDSAIGVGLIYLALYFHIKNMKENDVSEIATTDKP